jgi:hypothetical protein
VETITPITHLLLNPHSNKPTLTVLKLPLLLTNLLKLITTVTTRLVEENMNMDTSGSRLGNRNGWKERLLNRLKVLEMRHRLMILPVSLPPHSDKDQADR